MRVRGVLLVGMACAAAAWPARGQTTRALVPDAFAVAPGERVSLAVRSGPLAEAAAAWPGEQMRHFFVRSTGRQSNRDSVGPEADGAARWTLEHPGVSVVGFDLEGREEATTGAALAAFLDERVGPEAARPRVGEAEAITIRRVESFKTLVRVGGDGPGAVAIDKTGQRAEIRSLMDPTRLKAGSVLMVRLYADHASAPGGVVLARNLESGRVVREVADAEAIGMVRIDEPGAWMLEFHRLVAPEEEGVWTLFSSTLTFEVPAEDGR